MNNLNTKRDLDLTFQLSVEREIEGLSLWIRENTKVIQQLQDLDCPIKKVNKIAEQRVKKFNESLNIARRNIKSGKVYKQFSEGSFLYPNHTLIYLKLSELADLLFLNNPEYQQFRKTWDTFRKEFAILRQQENDEIKSKVKNFLSWVGGEIKRSGQKKLENIENFIHAFITIIEDEPNIMDLSFCTLSIQNLAQKRFNIPLKDQLKSDERLILKLTEDYLWVIKKINKILLPFTEGSGDLTSILTMEICKRLSVFKEMLGKDIHRFVIYDLHKFEEINSLFNKIHDFQKGNLDELAISNLSEQLKMKRLYRHLECKSRDQSLPEEHVFLLDDYADKEIDGYFIKSDMKIKLAMCTLAEIKENIDFMEANYQAYVLWDTYIQPSFLALHSSFTSIEKWYQKHHKKHNFNTLVELVNERKVEETTAPTQKKSVDELCAWIEGPDTKKPKTKRKRRINKGNNYKNRSDRGGNLKSKVVKLPKEPTVEKQEERSLSHKVENLNLQPTLSSALEDLIYNESSFSKKISLRQAKMYLDDHKAISSLPKLDRLLMAKLKLSTAYYHMEQLLRYHNITNSNTDELSFNVHNLNTLLYDLKEIQKLDTTALRKIYLANFWLHSTFEQYTQWTRFDHIQPPEMLLDLHKLNQVKKPGQLISKITKTADSVFHFSRLLQKASSSDVIESTDYKPEKRLSALKKTNRAIGRLSQILNDFSFEENHPTVNKLKQALQDLKTVKALVQTLSTTSTLSSSNLSLLVRQTFFWTNRVIEGLMQAIYAQQTYIDTYEHNHNFFLEGINWKQKLTEKEGDFIRDSLKGLNKVSRYPFELKKVISPIHELILQTEFLRERPELGEDFNYYSNDEMISTELNFVPISKEDLNIDVIMGKVNAFLNQALNIVNSKLIPELSS